MKTIKIVLVILLLTSLANALENQDKILDVTLRIQWKNPVMENITEKDGESSVISFVYPNYTDFDVELEKMSMNSIEKISPYVGAGVGFPIEIEILSESQTSQNYSTKVNFLESNISEVIFVITFDANMKYLKVSRLGKEKLNVNVRELLCNRNDNCDKFENFYSCPQDCPLNKEDGICESGSIGVCDPDCVYDEDCLNDDGKSVGKTFNFVSLFLIITAAVMILLVIIGMTVFSTKKKN